MKEALKTGLPRIKTSQMDEEASISIVCYGPSLKDTWEEIKRPMITMSGSLKFMAERGIVPEYHVDMDPRLQKDPISKKAKHIDPPIKGVHYLMASCCHPDTWKILKEEKVTLWHLWSAGETEDFVARNDPNELLVRSGSHIGAGALQIGGLLGYRHFEIFGMDGSLKEGERHAGPHYGHKQGGVTWQAGHVIYQTSRIMSNQCAEMINSFRLYPMFGVFHGSGLQQALIDEEYDLDNVALAHTPKAEMVRKAKISYMNHV